MTPADERELAHFEQMVADLVTYVERSVAADSSSVVAEVKRLSRLIRSSSVLQTNVLENLTRIEGDVEVLCSPRKWRAAGWEWHMANLNNAIAGLEMAADRVLDSLRTPRQDPPPPSAAPS